MATDKKRSSSTRVAESHRERLLRRESKVRPRLEFDAVEAMSPELWRRVVLLRSRVKDLQRKFSSDAVWAKNWFMGITWTVVVATALLIIELKDREVSNPMLLVSGIAVVGFLAAGVQAFGWHQRYHAMFRRNGR